MTGLMQALLTRVVKHGRIEVEEPSGERFTVGDGSGSPIAVRLSDRAAQHLLILNPQRMLGELYMEGRLIVTKGSLYDLLELLARNFWTTRPTGLDKTYHKFKNALRSLRKGNDLRRAQHNVRRHYNLDRRLYSLFLDEDLQYSCAYFQNASASIEEAQLAKKRHIAAKLLLEPGQRVLDIGSGWGGLAIYLAQKAQVAVTGVTLSEEQLAVAAERAEAHKLESRVRFRLQDYRNIAEKFDRIVSVGMFEHVGRNHYSTFFRKFADCMTESGVGLVHSIGRLDGPSPTNAWITKYIFPGSYVPALSEVLPSIERSGLLVTDIEILRLHYAETLKAWRVRFLARRHDAIKLFDERFARMWEFYLAACEVGFRYGGLMVFQIQLAKQIEAVPTTRDYIAQSEAWMAEQDGLFRTRGVAAE